MIALLKTFKNKEMKKYLILLFCGFNSLIYSQDTLKFTDLYGDYLGMPLASDTPVVFASDIVSSKYLEHSPAVFSPDGNELYWWINRPPDSLNKEWDSWGLKMKRINNRWTVPVKTELFRGSPFLTNDGNRIYFSSHEKSPCFIEKQGNNWSEPQYLNFVEKFTVVKKVFMLSITENGAIYFVGVAVDSVGTQNNYGIYRVKRRNGKYIKPELLPKSINLPPFLNWTPYIAPDDSYLIFSSNRTGSNDKWGDLYISFHDIETDKWSVAMNMGKSINTKSQERLPGLSPDGKYLFFTRPRRGYNQDVWWVKSDIIYKLKEFAVFDE
jgi:hypothetical protein